MRKILLFLFIFIAVNSYSQEYSADKYKAIFTVNVVRFFSWGDLPKTGNFTIGVLKNHAVANILRENVNGKKFEYLDLVVKEFDNVSELTECNVLYISKDVQISKNSNLFSGRFNKTLIVTEYQSGIPTGSVINFIVNNDRLKFEVSKKTATKQGLLVSNKLDAINNAIIVD